MDGFVALLSFIFKGSLGRVELRRVQEQSEHVHNLHRKEVEPSTEVCK